MACPIEVLDVGSMSCELTRDFDSGSHGRVHLEARGDTK